MNLKLFLAPLALVPMLALATPAAAAPVKVTVVYANKTAVIDTDTTFPISALRGQIEPVTGIAAKYMSIQVIAPKPAMLNEAARTLESYGIYTDFRAFVRAQATPNS
jgi:hypothetical protein